VVAAGAWSLSGCSFVPRSRLDECHRLSQTLQAEKDRLKDTAVSLRSQNQDLNQRAEDDARRLRLQEEEVQRLVQSVSAYQEEREQLAAAFERLKGQVRSTAAAGSFSTGLLRRCQDLARAHPGWEFDPAQGVLTIPAAQLFERGSDRLRPEAVAWLREAATLWSVPEAQDLDLLVVGRNETSAVRRAGLSAPETEDRPLGHDRAERVRDLLADAAHIDPARIEAAGFEVPHSGDDGPAGASEARNRRIEIHLRRRGKDSPAPAAPSPSPSGGAAADRSDP
jgi:chemotaxis protein MotB